ncbi:hypothetical protein ACFLYS_02670 [Chloroflexota bacterium]
MKGNKWLILLASLALVLLANGTGVTRSLFVDQESSSGNTLQAWTCVQYLQSTQLDFEAGVSNSVDTSSSAGDVLLGSIASPALVTSDNSAVSSSETAWQLVKTLTFTKAGAGYNELRIDSNLKKAGGSGVIVAYSSIQVDDVEMFSHSTNSNSYVSYSDVIDFSSYSDGEHTIKLYLRTSNRGQSADNSTMELYRITRTFASSGTIASQILDNGGAGTRWDGLFWGETLESNTDITFEVRASGTSFAKGDAAPSWTPIGGTSLITSGLPSGRYMQWRATLTTSDTSKTPVLHEVSVYYD